MGHVGNSKKGRTWALGAKMKYVQMQVVGIPRRDVLYRDDGTPLKQWMVEASLDGSRRYEVQRWIYTQMSRMKYLQKLVSGKMDCSQDMLAS
jgi:hypothetical protein